MCGRGGGECEEAARRADEDKEVGGSTEEVNGDEEECASGSCEYNTRMRWRGGSVWGEEGMD